MTYAHKINNHSYWQVQALLASVVSSLAMLAALICEKFSFYERASEKFSSLPYIVTHGAPVQWGFISPGYCWVTFLSSVPKVPLLKLHRFWLLAWSLRRNASSWSSLYPPCVLSFSVMLAFFHPLQPFLILFLSPFLLAVSLIWGGASLPSPSKHFTPFCHWLCSFPLLGADAS